MKKLPWNYFLSAGLLLVSAAILLGEAGWIPHGLRFFLMGLGVALELWGTFRKCREEKENRP